jgi:hypothetical protein
MQSGPRYLTDEDLQVLTLLNPSNVPANQPNVIHDEYGSIGQTADGRMFRYVSFAGTSTIEPGLLLTAAAAPSNSTGLAIAALTAQPENTATGNGAATGASALSAGSTAFNITNGSTSVTQDQFGYVEVIVSAGGTYNLKLRGNTAGGNGATVTLYLRDPLPQTITQLIPGTDTVNLRLNPYKAPTVTLTQGLSVGETIVSVPQSSTASYAGWVQTRGKAFVQATSGTLGYPVGQDSAGTAGFVINKSSGTTTPEIGVFITAEASSTANVFLKID